MIIIIKLKIIKRIKRRNKRKMPSKNYKECLINKYEYIIKKIQWKFKY